MKRGHIPIRTCRGCGRKVSKLELVRLVMVNGALVEDPDQNVAGRGVYCCRNEQCRTRLKKNKKTLRRLLRLQVG
jgi:predicted RNA-binding protein YlxR (DUF448 family)